MPEVSEIEIIRHFTRISTWNYAVDHGMYPLGSCTMKYNARVNETVARLAGLAEAHPYQPERISQGALRIIKMLSDQLIEITGMDAITLQPAAGAHGELTGILLVRAYLESQGNPRKKILVPDSAHGTNPATAAMCGYAVENLKSNAAGMVDIASLEAQVNEDVAALMLTNPNTLGVFEQEIHKIADVLHAKGALLYMDGANMNALVGKVRPGDFGADVMHLNLHKTFSTPHGGGGPGSGPVACKKILEPFLPTPVVITKPDGTLGFDYDRPQSIGRVRMFYGNFGMFVRALAYIMANGPEGLRQTTEDAVLNANYIRKHLEGSYDLPYYDADHARGGFQRPAFRRAMDQDRRHRQAADRLRVPSLHRQLPAGRARRADDRADGERVEGRARPVHRRHEGRSPRKPRTRRRSSPTRRTTRASPAWTKLPPPASRCCAGNRRGELVAK